MTTISFRARQVGRTRWRTGCWCTAGAIMRTISVAGIEHARLEPYAEIFARTVLRGREAREGLLLPGGRDSPHESRAFGFAQRPLVLLRYAADRSVHVPPPARTDG
jgi:hypothetical protein